MNKSEKVSSAGALDDLSKPHTASEENIGQCNSGSSQVTLTDATPEQQAKDMPTRIFWSRPFSAARLAASVAIDK